MSQNSPISRNEARAAAAVAQAQVMPPLAQRDRQRAQQPDRYARLIEPHRAALSRAAYRLTASHAEAEDLVQETLLRAYTRLHLIQNGEAVGGWLYKIQLNLFRNRYRRMDVLARPRPSLVSLDEGWVSAVGMSAVRGKGRVAS